MPMTESGKHMPYPSGKKQMIKEKISKLVREGKKQNQAVAIALSMARKKK